MRCRIRGGINRGYLGVIDVRADPDDIAGEAGG